MRPQTTTKNPSNRILKGGIPWPLSIWLDKRNKKEKN